MAQVDISDLPPPEELGAIGREPAQVNIDDLPPPHKLAPSVDVSDMPPPDKIDISDMPPPVSDDQKALDQVPYQIFKEKAGEAWEDLKAGAKTTYDQFKKVGPGRAADVAFNTAGTALHYAFEPFAKIFQTSDRLIGTGIGYASDAVLDTHIIADAEKRDRERSLKGQIPAGMIPVSFGSDIVAENVTDGVQTVANKMKESDSPYVRQMSYFMEGVLKPVAGIAANVMATVIADPIGYIRIGQYTKAGIEAEKIGEESVGLAQQLQSGEKSALQIKLPIAPAINVTPDFANNISAKMVYQAQKAVASFELTLPGRVFRGFTTSTGWVGADAATARHVMREQGREQQTIDFFRGIYQKHDIDFLSPGVQDELYQYSAKPGFVGKLVNPKDAQALFVELDSNLSKEVASARQAGVMIPDKKFPTFQEHLFNSLGPNATSMSEAEIAAKAPKVLQEWETMDERYVPRTVTPAKRAELLASKQFKDADEARSYVESLEDVRPEARGSKTSVFKERSDWTREKMNSYIEEKYGVKDYFHNDLVRAYAEKIDEVKAIKNKKMYLDSLTAQFGKSHADWVGTIEGARGRITLAEDAGLIPHPDDIKLAKLKVGDFRPVGEVAENAGVVSKTKYNWQALREMSPQAKQSLEGLKRVKGLEGIDRIVMPGPVADLVENVISRPRVGQVEAYMNNYMRAWKNAVFFNPGYHGRNMWESFVRAQSADVPLMELQRATRAIMAGDGPSAKYVEEFRNFSKGMTSMVDVSHEAQQSATTVGRIQNAVIEATPEMLQSDHPMYATQRALHEMASKGTLRQFLDESRQGLKKTLTRPFSDDSWLVDNKLYKWARDKGTAGENIPKLAMFADLRKQGYTGEQAMLKVNRFFPNYEITRDAVRSKMWAIPFLNYSVKNAENLMSVVLANPRTAAVYAPGGAIERALGKWGRYDADQTERTKKLLGEHYYHDSIISFAFPGQKQIEQEPDLIKKAIAHYMYLGDDNMKEKGGQLILKLPTNMHALSMLNPREVNDMAGPIVKTMVAFMGWDPFTGTEIKYAKDLPSTKALSAIQAGLKETVGGFIPTRAIGAGVAAMNAVFPEYAKHISSMGMNNEVLKTVLGEKYMSKWQEGADAHLSSVKLLMMGRMTKVDYDATLVRSVAMLRGAWSSMKSMIRDVGKGNRPASDKQRAIGAFLDQVDELKEIVAIKKEYDERIRNVGGQPPPEIDEVKTLRQDMGIPKDEEDDSGDSPETFDKAKDGVYNDAIKNRLPASVEEKGIFDRGSELTKRYLKPEDLSDYEKLKTVPKVEGYQGESNPYDDPNARIEAPKGSTDKEVSLEDLPARDQAKARQLLALNEEAQVLSESSDNKGEADSNDIKDVDDRIARLEQELGLEAVYDEEAKDFILVSRKGNNDD
jgi:hypothetical protein